MQPLVIGKWVKQPPKNKQFGVNSRCCQFPLSQGFREALLGFTLLEVLIVLASIAIVTAVAVLSIHWLGQGPSLIRIAHGVRGAIQSAEEEALLEPAIIKLQITRDGYSFYRQSQTEDRSSSWELLTHCDLSQPRVFQKGVKATWKLTDQQKAPILFFPSGDVTPFEIRLQAKAKSSVVIRVRHNGAVQLSETN